MSEKDVFADLLIKLKQVLKYKLKNDVCRQIINSPTCSNPLADAKLAQQLLLDLAECYQLLEVE